MRQIITVTPEELSPFTAKLKVGEIVMALLRVALCLSLMAAASMAAEANLRARFLKVAEAEFEKLNARPSTDSRSMLMGLINAGASRLEQERATEEQIRQAEENLKRFVGEMVKIGKARGDAWPDGRIRTGEPTFVSALQLCPVWPFC